MPAGIGDLVVGAGALALIVLPLGQPDFRRYLAIWNVVGCLDLLLVVVSAARIMLAAPEQLLALRYPPLSLLPAFLVPLLLAMHVILFIRMRRS